MGNIDSIRMLWGIDSIRMLCIRMLWGIDSIRMLWGI